MERKQGQMSWPALTEEVLTGMRAWQTAHPKASFTELEVAVEERLGRLRVRMVEEAALGGGARRREARAGWQARAAPTAGPSPADWWDGGASRE